MSASMEQVKLHLQANCNCQSISMEERRGVKRSTSSRSSLIVISVGLRGKGVELPACEA